MKKKVVIISIILSLLVLIIGIIVFLNIYNKNLITNSNKCYNDLFTGDVPNKKINKNNIYKCKKISSKILAKTEKNDINNKLDSSLDYYSLSLDIDNLFVDGNIKSSVSSEQINKIKKSYDKLDSKYQKLLIDKINLANKQLNDLNLIDEKVKALFSDYSNLIVRDNVSRDEYNSVLGEVNSIKQEDIRTKKLESMKVVDSNLCQKEEAERKRIEEERKRAEAERQRILAEKRAREEAIKRAWVVLNVPYISQNRSGVINGCEAASLLMGLKYKGYLSNMNIFEYATLMPKSDDPNTGFILDIFGADPTNLTHWIAPEPLKNFGISTSGNHNIINSTGYSLSQLDNEISNNNPVVIYLTAKFKEPKNWNGGVPVNLHVLLLTGYNKITGEQIITDPWTYSSGFHVWTESKSTIENIYNKVGRKSVIIK